MTIYSTGIAAKEVTTNLVYPDKKEKKNKTGKPAKAQDIRYIASVEKTKKKVRIGMNTGNF